MNKPNQPTSCMPPAALLPHLLLLMSFAHTTSPCLPPRPLTVRAHVHMVVLRAKLGEKDTQAHKACGSHQTSNEWTKHTREMGGRKHTGATRRQRDRWGAACSKAGAARHIYACSHWQAHMLVLVRRCSAASRGKAGAQSGKVCRRGRENGRCMGVAWWGVAELCCAVLCVGMSQGEGVWQNTKCTPPTVEEWQARRHCGAAARKERHLIHFRRPQMARDERQGANTGRWRRVARRSAGGMGSWPARPLSSAPESNALH